MIRRELHNNKELFSRISEDSHDAFDTLFGLYKKRLYRYALQLLKSHDEADEAVQEVFVKLWVKRDVLDSVGSPDHYIFTVLRNIVLDRLRKIAADRRLRSDVWKRMEALSRPVEDLIEAAESDGLVKEAFGKLSPARQTIFRLSRQDGLSHDQIAQKLKISKNTVKNQLVTSLRLLREYLAHFTAIFLFFLRY